MRLVSARVRGFGRLTDSTIKLDQKLIAVVGPNEAGKTTLLRALSYVESDAPLDLAQRSRALDTSGDDEVIRLRYLLEDHDRAALKDLDLREDPIEFNVSRLASGRSVRIGMKPHPRKTEEPLARSLKYLRDALSLLRGPLEAGTFVNADDESAMTPDEAAQLINQLDGLAFSLGHYLETDDPEKEDVSGFLDQVTESREQLKGFHGTESLTDALDQFIAWCEIADPEPEVRDRLWRSSPEIVMFTDADRSLKSSYNLDRKLPQNAPAPLRSLARLAGLNLQGLADAVENQQISKRETILKVANRNLHEHFARVWKQSKLAVEFQVDGGLLRIGVTEDQVYASLLSERSQGLRAFVALTSFLAARDTERPAILLVDEAENHLHMDAQADLIDMFAEQQQAEKIIYTTHSPACLPRDLGVGIRAVVADGDETSHINNSFWTMEGNGFTPVMFAMGASAAAFTPARYTVIAEGPSDMMLLPSFIRESTGLKRLPYQIAPGLSEAPKKVYPDLDAEGARVAFVVDGDQGGDSLAKQLAKVFPCERIVGLPFPGIENVLIAEIYRDVFMDVLENRNAGTELPPAPELPEVTAQPWARTLEDWAAGLGLSTPSKTEVAYRILDLEEIPISEAGSEALKSLHHQLTRALKLEH